MHIRAELGTDRDACLVSTVEHELANSFQPEMAFVASTSVDDPLVPYHGTRTQIHLNGYCFRALPRAPYFEPPPPRARDDGDASAAATAAARQKRPGHRRTKSSMSFKQTGGMLSPSAVQPPLPTTDGGFPFQSRNFGSNGNGNGNGNRSSSPREDERDDDNDDDDADDPARGRAAMLSPSIGLDINPFDMFTSPPPPARSSGLPTTSPETNNAATAATPSSTNRPGVHVSLLVHVSPGFNLPQTTVNQLSVHLPLSIASINRFLSTYGFPAYIVRNAPEAGLHIMDERFDAVAATYRVVYRVTRNQAPPVRIRFHGSTFAKGRFTVDVHGGPEDWELEYDVEPDFQPEITRTTDRDPTLGDDDVMRKDRAAAAGSTISENQSEQSSSTHQLDGRPRPRPPNSRKTSLSVLASPLSQSDTVPLPSFSMISPSSATPTSPGGRNMSSPADPRREQEQKRGVDDGGTAGRRGSVDARSVSETTSRVPTAAPVSRDQAPQQTKQVTPLDPATLPGPLGGCTLVIPAPDELQYHAVTVTITKNPAAVSRPLDGMSVMSAALGRAARIAAQSNWTGTSGGHSGSGSNYHSAHLATATAAATTAPQTVEELLEQSQGSGRARVCLNRAKIVLEELHRAQREEHQRRVGNGDGDDGGVGGVNARADRLAKVVRHHHYHHHHHHPNSHSHSHANLISNPQSGVPVRPTTGLAIPVPMPMPMSLDESTSSSGPGPAATKDTAPFSAGARTGRTGSVSSGLGLEGIREQTAM